MAMEGRIQKAREGKWNGGFAPYGYRLMDGKLYINEEEAEAIRIIYDQYVNADIGANGVAKYLENHGIRKIQRQNGKNPLFDAHLMSIILWSRIITFWRTDSMKQLLRKMFGRQQQLSELRKISYICMTS